MFLAIGEVKVQKSEGEKLQEKIFSKMAQTLTQKIKKNVLKKAHAKAEDTNGTIVREEPTTKAEVDMFKGVLEAYDKQQSLGIPVTKNDSDSHGSPKKARMQFGGGGSKFARSPGAKNSLMPSVSRKAVSIHSEKMEAHKSYRGKNPEEDGKSIFRKVCAPVIFFA